MHVSLTAGSFKLSSLQTPQIWESYQLQSGEGLSVSFIVLWLLGDITNAFGGILAKLLPTMIILASYVGPPSPRTSSSHAGRIRFMSRV